MIKIIQLTVFFLLVTLCAATAQQVGNASFYSHKMTGRHTTDGSKYHPDSLTCAHQTFPLGTYLMVRNPKNNQQVVVKVTDRGPFTKRLMIDLSYSAAKALDIVRQGIATVEITKFNFLPQAMSLLPIPQTYLNVEQIYVMSNYVNKLIADREQNKKK